MDKIFDQDRSELSGRRCFMEGDKSFDQSGYCTSTK